MQEGFIARLARGIGAAVKSTSWFGPQAPLPPMAPPDVAGRQFDYPFGFNLAIGPRVNEPTGFRELRALADSYDLLRSVIETRKDQIERLSWSIRPRNFAAAGAAGGAGAGKQISPSDPRIAALTAFFQRPDKAHSWTTWLRMLLEDLLVIDAPTLYLRRTRGGALWALEPLDGATVKRLIDDWGRTPAPPAPAYQQILKGMPAVDYTADELIYAPRNARIHKAYGFSPVEQVQMSVSIALRRQIYQLQYYTEGNIPEALIGVPETWNPDQIRQFQAYWDSINAGDTGERRHAKFVPGGVAKTFIPTREPALKDVFDEWLARVVCFAFSIPPTPFVQQTNRATADTAQEAALTEGLVPLQNWVKGLVDGVLAEEFAAPDLEFAWSADKAADPADIAKIATSYVASGIKTVNEVRGELGLPPVPGGDRAVFVTAQGPVALDGAEKLLRFNPNHYGPGPQGGQFAPSGEGGDGGGDGSLDPLDIGGDGGDDDGSDGSDDAGDDEPDVGSNDDSGLDDDSGDDDPVTPANNLPDANPDPGTAGGDPELVPASSTGMQLPYAQVAELVRENNVSDQSNELMLAIIWQESSFYPSAKNNFGTASGSHGRYSSRFRGRHVQLRGLSNRRGPDRYFRSGDERSARFGISPNPNRPKSRRFASSAGTVRADASLPRRYTRSRKCLRTGSF